MLPADQLAVILPMLTHLVGRIEPAQLDAATPCAAFTVGELVDHIVTRAEWSAAELRGVPPPPPGTAAPAGAGAHPAARVRASMADLLDAVQSPRALSRTADVTARFIAFDGLVHGWDLAMSTGQAYTPPDEVTVAVAEFARRALVPGMRDGDTFVEEIEPPDDADHLLRLIAFSGRTPEFPLRGS